MGDHRDASLTVELERTCSACGATKPARAFTPRARKCAACESRRRREGERIRSDPECATAVNRAVDSAPDPSPAVRLRAELAAHRDAGRPFATAWPLAVNAAVRDLPPIDQADWRAAMRSMRALWGASYSRRPWPVNLRPALFVNDREAEAA